MDATVELPARDSVSEESKWDLNGLYATGDKWREDFASLESAVSGYAGFVGTLNRSTTAIKTCLEFDLGVSRKLDALHTYAHLRNDEDQTHTSNQENFENVMSLHTRIMGARSFLASELMSIPENRVCFSARACFFCSSFSIMSGGAFLTNS